jgi:hypothetical protein
MIGLIALILIIAWTWIGYEMWKAPELDENHKIVEKKDDSLDLDLKNDEFLN